MTHAEFNHYFLRFFPFLWGGISYGVSRSSGWGLLAERFRRPA